MDPISTGDHVRLRRAGSASLGSLVVCALERGRPVDQRTGQSIVILRSCEVAVAATGLCRGRRRSV